MQFSVSMSRPYFFANTLAITNGENLYVSRVFRELSYVFNLYMYVLNDFH